MKKLFTTLALIGGATIASQAQESILVQPIILSAPAEINCTDSFEFGWAFVNHGPYTIQLTDTFGFNDFEAESETAGWIGYLPEGSAPVAPGDTFFVNLWNSHYDRIGWAVDYTVEDYAYTPLANGEYGFLVQFFGFYTNNGTSWVGREDIIVEDPNEEDDIRLFNGVLVNVNCATDPSSIANNSLASNINVYPNPANNNINFSYNFDAASNAVATVYDVTGRQVMVKDFGKQAAGTQVFTINTANLPAGNYTLDFTTDNNKGVSKFVIAK